MRTTLNIDDDMLAKAIAYSGIAEKARLLNHVLERFVRNEAARRLSKLSGTMPDLEVPARSAGRYDVPSKEPRRASVAETTPKHA
jgi:Arc/MetJ family transcription regulator